MGLWAAAGPARANAKAMPQKAMGMRMGVLLGAEPRIKI
jgi:hypothetical protein